MRRDFLCNVSLSKDADLFVRVVLGDGTVQNKILMASAYSSFFRASALD